MTDVMSDAVTSDFTLGVLGKEEMVLVPDRAPATLRIDVVAALNGVTLANMREEGTITPPSESVALGTAVVATVLYMKEDGMGLVMT